MTITILAVLFIVLMLAIAAFGYRIIIRQGKPAADAHTERCSICRSTFDTSLLVERQIGDTRVSYFCASCIRGLFTDLTTRT